eukprot:scaffold297958_cov24-Tisochrysis_lutea.AAC.2
MQEAVALGEQRHVGSEADCDSPPVTRSGRLYSIVLPGHPGRSSFAGGSNLGGTCASSTGGMHGASAAQAFPPSVKT